MTGFDGEIVSEADIQTEKLRRSAARQKACVHAVTTFKPYLDGAGGGCTVCAKCGKVV